MCSSTTVDEAVSAGFHQSTATDPASRGLFAMTNQSLAAIGWVVLCGVSVAAECPLNHGIYTEASSGAVLAFHPKTAEHGIMTSGVFELTLPNLAQSYAGEITWTAGRNSRPYGFIDRPCPEPTSVSEPEACWLWRGNVYSVGNGTVSFIEDDDMMAPQVMLLADFGHALLWDQAFLAANPRPQAMDLFTRTGCAP
jgi:hypothetical protein